MAAGDAYQIGPSSIASGGAAYLSIRPGAGVEAVIHNVYVAGAAEIQYWDGANPIVFDSVAAAGGWLNQAFHVTNGVWLRVRNVSTVSAVFMAADGMVTK